MGKADIKGMAKLAGLSETELRGKSLGEQIKLITQKMNEEKEALEIESVKELVDNYTKQVPKLKNAFETPFELYVKKVGQRKSPTSVPVVGYNHYTSSVIVLFGDKLYQIEDGDVVKSVDDFMVAKQNKKTKSGTKKKK